jgi:hypothetical protein
MSFKIVNYNDNLFNEWDNFIKISINGTIYQTRKFLSYHDKNKFLDSSILIYKNEILSCVLPSCKLGENFFSHKGATYGGPVFSKEVYNIKNMDEILNLIFSYYDNKIEFRIPNSIYHEYSDNILLYLLGSKLKMCPELAWYISVEDDVINNIKNIRNKKSVIKMINNENYTCQKFTEKEDYISYYEILLKNLKEKYNTNPTHTLTEFLLLKEILLNNQSLYLVKKENIIYGGVFVIKVTKNCWYTFYISKNIDINNNMSIIYIMNKIKEDAKKENVKYIDYGITTENSGKILNKGLSEFKELSLCGKSTNRYLFLK